MFSKMIEVTSGIGSRMSGGKVEAARPTGMPADGTLLYPGGQVTNEYVLGVLETRTYTGQSASAALALNRMTAAPNPRSGGLRRTVAATSTNVFAGSASEWPTADDNPARDVRNPIGRAGLARSGR